MESSKQKINNGLKITALFLISLTIALVCAEVTLRIVGFKPWQPSKTVGNGNREAMPLMTERHPVLGWVNKPGKYDYSGFSPEVESISVTILPGSDRLSNATGRLPDKLRDKVVFVGGSYTQGYAISDDETMAWKVQEQFPDHDVINLGVPGYGTYQSLLMLEEYLPDMEGRKVIFYGYIDHHQFRNILHSTWVDMLSRPEGDSPLPPYATVSNSGELVRHSVSSRRTWPLRGSLALVNAAETTWIKFGSRNRADQNEAVTKQTLSAMQALAEAEKAQLVILLLSTKGVLADGVTEYMQSNSIEYLDCVPENSGPDYRVTGEGHPNGMQNSLWAKCIADYLRPQKDETGGFHEAQASADSLKAIASVQPTNP
jgi:hypothetical protein